MADIQTKGKNAPSVDMTPMVDLGFLLITFFMLATTFSKPKMIKMISPADTPVTIDVKCSRTLTILLCENDKLKYYVCPESGVADSIDFSSKGLRDIILKRQKEVTLQWGSTENFVVLIKSAPNSKYNRLVDAIDEMRISGATFTLAALEKTDSLIFKLHF